MSQLQELIDAITKWHTSRVSNIQKILDTPGNVEVRFQRSDGTFTVLDAADVKGFRMGLVLAQEFFEKLPFKVSTPRDDVAGNLLGIVSHLYDLEQDPTTLDDQIDECGYAKDIDWDDLHDHVCGVFMISIDFDEFMGIKTLRDAVSLIEKAIAAELLN